LLKRASSHRNRILFPESDDGRVLAAIVEIIRLGLCHPVLLGDERRLRKLLQKKGLHTAANGSSASGGENSSFSVLSRSDSVLCARLAQKIWQIRKKKGLTPAAARELIREKQYFATAALAAGLADGMVSGATTTTADVLRPALQIIRTVRGKRASGAFLLIPPPAGSSRKKTVPAPRGPLLFADCAVTPHPDAMQLAEIAQDTARTARMLGLQPRLALLSFSTHGSAGNLEEAKKIRLAFRLLKKSSPKLICDGELQADAALEPAVARLKAPRSPLHGRGNVLIFPNLDAGNIGYKLVERLAGARAIGTIVQGLKKPVNDLSRGCNSTDIVNLTAVTVLQTLAN
jgi:phosphate acetyltransferase